MICKNVEDVTYQVFCIIIAKNEEKNVLFLVDLNSGNFRGTNLKFLLYNNKLSVSS